MSDRTLLTFTWIQRPARVRVWRRWAWLAAPILLMALVLAFFWKLAFSGLILARGDVFLYFYPYWNVAAEALREGRVPLWNPHIFMGAPFVANSQAGFFYPPNWPLWLLLPTPFAVSASIVLHLLLAAAGTYLLARRKLRLSVAGATLASLGFALGGYLTAQVEHVNQLQGLAWLPWLLAVGAGIGEKRERSYRLRTITITSIILALQLTAGHTQTLFISFVALLLFRVAEILKRREPLLSLGKPSSALRLLSAFVYLPAGAILLALLLGAVQLLPTLELLRFSGRQGGLPLSEVVSFSLHPAIWSQALLPRYGESLFTEYVAFLPVSMLLLAFVAAWQWRQESSVWPALVLTIGGFLLALGAFNPLYLLLARLPGFGYFRAPARWMALYGLGVPLLAGYGLDMLRGVRGAPLLLKARSALTWAAAFVIGLILLGYVAPHVAAVVPVGPEVTVRSPTLLQSAAVLLELAIALLAMRRLTQVWRSRRQRYVAAILSLPLAVLFVASRPLPANQLTTPAAYYDLRAPVARLQALRNCRLLPDHCSVVPQRSLSLSNILFDPGDLTELEIVYAPLLPEQGFRDFIIAVKQKEIVAPNLPMIYDLASVDGFDGGILPLRNYSLLSSLLLEDNEVASDGRLREYLEAIPPARWLDLLGARYLITDKVGDEWREGVFFDTQHAQRVTQQHAVSIGEIPPFEATEIWVLGAGADIRMEISAESVNMRLSPAEQLADDLWRIRFQGPITPTAITLLTEGDDWHLRGIALVDGRDGTFQTLVPGDYRLLYSGDVKIYENLDVMPRIFVVHSWQYRAFAEDGLRFMETETFDPGEAAVVIGDGQGVSNPRATPGTATIVSYGAEEIVVDAHLDEPGLLVLSDAFYPGWQTTVDGRLRKVQQVDVLFRGVTLAAGDHVVRFSFVSQPYLTGKWISIATLLGYLGLFVVVSIQWLRRHGTTGL